MPWNKEKTWPIKTADGTLNVTCNDQGRWTIRNHEVMSNSTKEWGYALVAWQTGVVESFRELNEEVQKLTARVAALEKARV